MARTSIQEIFASFASFPSVGGSNVLYIATDTDTLYRWNGSTYVAIGGGTATTATNLAGGAGGSIPYQSSAGVTAMLANGTAGYLLQSNGTTLAPSWVAAPAGFSWGSSITGTTGTGSLLTMGNSYAASGIGQSIVISNTQTQRLVGLNVDTGTSTPLHTGIQLNSNQTDRAYSMQIRHYSSATQAVTAEYALVLGDNWNTSSANNTRKIFIENENNAGAGENTGIYINHYNTTGSAAAGEGNAFTIYQSGAGGTAMHIYADNNTNSSTNGIVNYTLSNTQSGATVMQKINLGSSAQAHSAYYVTGSNASTTAKAFNAAMATGYTGFLFHGSLNAVDKCTIDYNGDYIGAGSIKTGAPNGGTAGAWKTGIYVGTGTSVFRTDAYVELDIGGTLYKLALCTNS